MYSTCNISINFNINQSLTPNSLLYFCTPVPTFVESQFVLHLKNPSVN